LLVVVVEFQETERGLVDFMEEEMQMLLELVRMGYNMTEVEEVLVQVEEMEGQGVLF
jgi:hypothetical protein